MNGPEHYREAETLADQAHAVEPGYAAYLVAKAQVHATLALAAATAMVSADIAADGETGRQWRELIVAKRPQPIEVPS